MVYSSPPTSLPHTTWVQNLHRTLLRSQLCLDENLPPVPAGDLKKSDQAELQAAEQSSEVGCCFPACQQAQAGCIAMWQRNLLSTGATQHLASSASGAGWSWSFEGQQGSSHCIYTVPSFELFGLCITLLLFPSGDLYPHHDPDCLFCHMQQALDVFMLFFCGAVIRSTLSM